jgi:hypothetical protein
MAESQRLKGDELMYLRAKLLSQDGLVVYTDWLVLNAREVRSQYDTLIWISGTLRVPRDLPTDPEELPENVKQILASAYDFLLIEGSVGDLEPPSFYRPREYLLRDDRGMEALVTITDERPIAVFSGPVHRLPN